MFRRVIATVALIFAAVLIVLSVLFIATSGGPKGAITGTMTMVIGAADEDLARAEPVLAAMSAKRVHVGGVGAGHVAKIANNLLVASHLLVAGEVDQTGHAPGMKRVADMIKGAEFGVVSGSGHYPWAENPGEFNEIFFSFLDRHVPAR